MMACAAFEDRLVDYADLSPAERIEVDDHLQRCDSCREYATALRDIETMLVAQIHSVHMDPSGQDDARRVIAKMKPVGRITRLPEWLDFVAAGALLAFSGAFAWQAGMFGAVLNLLTVP